MELEEKKKKKTTTHCNSESHSNKSRQTNAFKKMEMQGQNKHPLFWVLHLKTEIKRILISNSD